MASALPYLLVAEKFRTPVRVANQVGLHQCLAPIVSINGAFEPLTYLFAKLNIMAPAVHKKHGRLTKLLFEGRGVHCNTEYRMLSKNILIVIVS